MEKSVFRIFERGRQTASKWVASPAVSIPFELELYGQPVAFEAVCADSRITLKDLVYPAHQLSDIVVRRAIEHQRLCGNPVACSAGCMECCKYAITVSLAEAFALNDMIKFLPRQPKQALLGKMTEAGTKILSSCLSVSETMDTQHAHFSNQLIELSRWYSAMDLVCPWLRNKLCSEYPSRPLVCREFLVTSSPNRCSPKALYGRNIVDLPIKMAEVLMTVCAKLTNTNALAIFLPLVPVECEDFAELQNKYYDARRAAGLLVETIIEHRQRVAEPVTLCC
jgi:Fe-S-cluster containining protein